MNDTSLKKSNQKPKVNILHSQKSICLSYSGERWQYAAVPVEWSASGNDYTAMGVVGYVMSGGTVYDHRSSPMGDIASYNEWDSLDPSFGHSDNNNQYHYHAVSVATFITK